MHRRSTDASRTRRRIPAEPMTRSSSTRPSVSESGRPAATLAAAGTPHRAPTPTPGRRPARSAPAAAIRRAGARCRAARRSAFGPIGSLARCGASTSSTSPIRPASSSSTACCSAMRSAYQSNARVVGQIAVLVRIVLDQNLIHDQLVDAHAHQRQRPQRAGRLRGDHALGRQHQMCAHPRPVGQQRADGFPSRRRSAPARPRPPPSPESSAARASRRCRGHARSRYIPNVAGSVSIRSASAVDAQSTTT